MKVIRGPRQSGKTNELIKLASANRAYMVVFSYAEAQRVARLALEMKTPISFPITYEEFAKGEFYGKGIAGFVVDDVEDLLRYMARGAEMIGYSVEE